MNARDRKGKRVAIHEVGHAVVAWQLGMKLRSITIEARDVHIFERPHHAALR
jgi:hypothetical protein